MNGVDGKTRCWGDKDPLMKRYHDEEWGTPVHDDKKHYRMLVFEGAQAGLNWRIVLQKSEEYRKAFSDFDPIVVAAYEPERIDYILKNMGVIRNRRKVESAINNARAFLKVQAEFGSFDHYIWSFMNYKPVMNEFKEWKQVPSSTDVSITISKDLKRRGFSFVGPTIIYAYMQSVGMVNDHLVHCFRWGELKEKYGA
jgi:DNA-3-methyladenine glycosylase I